MVIAISSLGLQYQDLYLRYLQGAKLVDIFKTIVELVTGVLRVSLLFTLCFIPGNRGERKNLKGT